MLCRSSKDFKNMIFSESERIYIQCLHESPHTLTGSPIVSQDGDRYFYKDGKLHRRDGLPAVELLSGYRAWYVNGCRHNEGGPARQWSNCQEEWYVDGEMHRDGDKLAVTTSKGVLIWYKKGKRHRNIEKGPARITRDCCEWWVDGVYMCDEDPSASNP